MPKLADQVVNRPKHYRSSRDGLEAIDVIEAFGLGFHEGNAIKYILRAGRKGPALEDLQKAVWYLVRHARLSKGKIIVVDEGGNVSTSASASAGLSVTE